MFRRNNQHNPMCYLPSLLFLFGLLILFSVSEADNEWFADCHLAGKRCGDNLFDIHYPFWLDTSPDYCGHPGFKLSCNENTKLLANFRGKNYTVNSINYNSHLLKLTDDNFSSQRCPQTFTNITFNSSLFNYTSDDANLTVYLNCSPKLPSQPYLHDILCPASDSGYHSYYSLPKDHFPPPIDVWNHCSSVAFVPINQTTANNLLTKKDFVGTLLHEGFGLTWKVEDEWCRKCMNSTGICWNGAPTSSDGGDCYCSKGSSVDGTCQRNNKHLRIAIGVSVGVVFLIGCCLALFLYKRRKRQQLSVLSNLLSWTTSSKISSKKDLELGEANYHTHIFSYDELEEATNGFDASRELGDGGFGTVYKGKLRDGRTVAVKRLYENNYRRLEQFINEVEILSDLRHQNLVTLYGCTSRHSRELLLVYEFIPNGTVADHLHGSLASNGALPWPVRMSIAIETADALAYLHAIEPSIIHRDIKSNNILLDNNFHVKVADFGLSRLFPLDATHVSTAPQGTPGYVDPEYHQCYQLTDKSDVYSFGVVLIELISSKPAVDISRHRHEINLANMAINKIQKCQVDQLVDPELGYQSDLEMKSMINQVAELAFRCLQLDRDMRPGIKEVLEVLRAIETGGYKVEKVAEATEVQTLEETRLLKNVSPFSPDSVAERWTSRSTTPNTSG